MGEMRIIASEGDQKVVWDKDNDDEVEAAEATFDSLLEKKFKAYSVAKDGTKSKEIKKFKSSLGAIIMVPAIAGG